MNARSNARVLIVEDEPAFVRFAVGVLSSAGYDSRLAGSGRAAIAELARYRPEVAIVDVTLPDVSGLELCETIAGESDVPVIVVSANATEDIRLTALAAGAEEFLAKPTTEGELLAHVASALRRSRSRAANAEGLRLGDVRLLRDANVAEYGAAPLDLTALEFRLLWALGESEGRLLTRADLLERVWNDVSGVATRVVDVHVAALRKKLGAAGSSLRIASVRGAGYRLDVR